MKRTLIALTLIGVLFSSSLYAKDKKDDPISKEDMAKATLDIELPSPGALVLRLQGALGDIQWKDYIEIKKDSPKSTKQDFAFYLGIKGADAYFLTVSKDTTNLIATSKKIHKSMNKLKVNNKSTKKILGNLKKDLSKSKIDKATWEKVLADITILKDEISANLNSKYKDGDKTILYDVGGWLEGYRLAANAIKDKYSKKDTSILAQDKLVSYLLKKLQGSSKAQKFAGYKDIKNALKEISSTLSKAKDKQLTKKQVDSLVTTLSKIKSYI